MPSSGQAWETLGTVGPADLVDARLELHWALQVADAVGRSLFAPEPDGSQISFSWYDPAGALVSGAMADGSRVGLALASLELIIIGLSGEVEERFSLAGHTMHDATSWVHDRVANRLGQMPGWTDHKPDVPDAPVGRGEPFGRATDRHAELACWYGNASRLLEAIRATDPRAAPVRAWPHHFDIATFINLDPHVAQYEGRSINVGWSPGDATYPAPYFYVVPHPEPVASDLPGLEAGRWHIEGWIGAVLTAEDTLGHTDPADVAAAFNREAIASLRAALGDGRER
ncbi:MAG: hypothetical protein OEU54_06015, partial [Gemmatimonadota bacterium]|nr:hypothetical protein [Gemmatimonadota bacterium]